MTTGAGISNARDPSTGSRVVGMVYPNGRIILRYGYNNNALDNAIGRVDYLA
jgi:hypothetical protein